MRGTANDAEADGITSLRPNGVYATRANGFANWQAIAPLEVGINSPVVEVAGSAASNYTAVASTSIASKPFFMTSIASGIFDSACNRNLIPDRGRDVLFAFHAITGEPQIIQP